jgi:hypothetical protein
LANAWLSSDKVLLSDEKVRLSSDKLPLSENNAQPSENKTRADDGNNFDLPKTPPSARLPDQLADEVW